MTAATTRRCSTRGIAVRRLAAAMGVLLATIAAARGQTTTPAPVLFPQQASTWCWAAATETVLRHLQPNGPFGQPLQAEKAVLGCLKAPAPDDLCGDKYPTFAGCNRPGFPPFASLGYTAETRSSPLSWELLKEELDSCRPVLFGWCLEGRCGRTPRTSRGHWMVALAADTCRTDDGEVMQMVKVFNPTPCCRGQQVWIPYGTYAQGSLGLKFWRNYYQVRLEGQPAPRSNTTCQRSAAGPATSLPRCEALDDEGAKAFAAAAQEGPPTAAVGVERRYLPMAALSALTQPPKDHAAHLRSATSAAGGGTESAEALPAAIARITIPLRIVPVKRDGRAVRNLVLGRLQDGREHLLAVEDDGAARSLQDRLAEAQEPKNRAKFHAPFQEYVVLETGAHILVSNAQPTAADPTREAIVLWSELDCRKPASRGDVGSTTTLEKVIETLTIAR